MYNVQIVVNNNLCISCGICMAVCPQKCITMSKHDGLYTPSICSQCTKCGYCFDICPGKGKIRDSDEKLKYEELIGKYNNIYNGWSKDEIIRHYSASGGVVTTIIHELLKSNSYDVAFVVRDFSYNHYVETCSVRAEDADGIIDFTNDESFTAKSRYIPIGHGKAVDYILKNPMQKVIIIGTSCAIRGFLNVIQQRKLKRDNYLLIGLFCESVMNYLVWDYFMQKKFTKGNTIAALHFKNKESGGWPGNIKMVFTDGSHRYYDSSYRIEVKPYLKPKRCLYCIDKLNVKADISLGDNYTGENDSALGSNTVIIRTEFGETAWKNCINKIEFKEVSEVKVIKAQELKNRATNLDFAYLKEKEIKDRTGLDIDINGLGKQGVLPDINRYNKQIADINTGEAFSRLKFYLNVSHIERRVKTKIKKLIKYR